MEDDRRSNIRYNPDKNSLLTVSQNDSDEIVGLMRDVSEGGCAGIFHQEYFNFNMGDSLRVTTEEFGEQTATIAWTKNIDKRFLKVGFDFEGA